MRLVLTGTPLQNHLEELHSVMSFVDPRTFTSSDVFSVETPEQVEQTKNMVRPYILRQTKAKLPELVPPRHELILHVSMTKLQRELYRATLSRNVKVLRDILAALQANGDVSDASEETAKGLLRSDTTIQQKKKSRVSSVTRIALQMSSLSSPPNMNIICDSLTRVNKHVEHGHVEQVLWLGASWVFGEDAHADECTIVYNVEKIRALLDLCKRVVEAEQKAISAPEDFSRVWVADLDDEMHELEDTAEDTVSDVWMQLLSRTDQSASVVQLPSEDVNCRLLRVRKHKVDYVADDTKRKSGPVDAEFVPDEIELMELHIVAKGNLLSMHRKRLVASYSHALNEQTAKQAREVKAIFAALANGQLANGRRVQPGVIPGVQVPEQSTSFSLMCTTPHGHSYCPFITDPLFISAVRSIKPVLGYWHHTHFHKFVAWYCVQYVWFVLVHEEGEQVHKTNMKERPEYMVDASE
ncbi:hypothetical protein GGH12_006047 [Coemansia sp. RSA 1822]|nr:hypothetical protein GGH12_006047 [Coemansia sp. RSA 1822]